MTHAKASSTTYYSLLGLPPSASVQDIRRAYRDRSKLYHPDTTDLPPDIATAKFQQLNEAYATLSSPEKRLAYDQSIGYSRIPVIQVPADFNRPVSRQRRPYPSSSAYLDPSDRPLSPGEIFALFLLGVTFVACLILVVAISVTQGESAFQTRNLNIPTSTAPARQRSAPAASAADSPDSPEPFVSDSAAEFSAPKSAAAEPAAAKSAAEPAAAEPDRATSASLSQSAAKTADALDSNALDLNALDSNALDASALDALDEGSTVLDTDAPEAKRSEPANTNSDAESQTVDQAGDSTQAVQPNQLVVHQLVQKDVPTAIAPAAPLTAPTID